MLNAWLKARRERAARTARESGFGWACTEILLNGKSEDDVEAYIAGSGDPFDRGARDALCRLGRQAAQ